MAKAIPVPSKRGTTFFINPADLTIDETLNGRAFPYTDKEIYSKACSLKAHGQLQPIVIQRQGGKAFVVAGTGRTLGALYLNQNDADFKAEPFLLECVVQGDDVDSFGVNVAENFDRKTLTPVDVAHIIGMSDARQPDDATHDARNEAVAALFGMPNNNDTRKWIERHRQIATLPTSLRKKIHTKTLAVDAALEYVGLDPETAEAVHAEAEKAADGKKVTKARVKKAKAAKGAKAAKDEKPVSNAMSKPALVSFLSYQVEHNKQESVKQLCNGLLGLLSGEVVEPEMLKILKKVCVPNKGD